MHKLIHKFLKTFVFFLLECLIENAVVVESYFYISVHFKPIMNCNGRIKDTVGLLVRNYCIKGPVYLFFIIVVAGLIIFYQSLNVKNLENNPVLVLSCNILLKFILSMNLIM